MKKTATGRQEVSFVLVMSLISTVTPETWALCSRSSPIARLLFSCFVAHGETTAPETVSVFKAERQGQSKSHASHVYY